MQEQEKREEFISVIIPVYNESSRIFHTLSTIDDYFRSRFRGFEIIVVNDGSLDDTRDIVLRARGKITSIKYVGYRENRGKGYAIRQGVFVSTGDLILISDADLSAPVEEVEKLLVVYDSGYHIIIGSRAMKGSDIRVKQPAWRMLMGKTFNRLVRLLLLKEFKDTQCGFKLFQGAGGRELFRRATIDRFAYDVEILCLAKRAGHMVKEVPIRWDNSPGSKVNPVRDSLQMAKDILKIRLGK